jgi:hypothetical protein
MTTAVKDSKRQILDAFQAILASQPTSRVATKDEEAERSQNQQLLATVADYSTDRIVRGLADLQLEFGGLIQEMSTKLSSENGKLGELSRAIAVSQAQLAELRRVRIVADARHILTQEHQESLQALAERSRRAREVLEKEQADTRRRQAQEQAEYDLNLAESQAFLQQERLRAEADFSYEADRLRRVALDDYETLQRQQSRDLADDLAAYEKDWAERQRLLDSNAEKRQVATQLVEAFPAELDEAVKQAREEGIRDVNQDARVKAELLEADWQGQQQAYQLQIDALEAKLQQQVEQIAALSNQLQTATQQAQSLAMRAFEGSTDRINRA